MPYKNLIIRKKYHRDYYLSHRKEQLKKNKELRKLFPWKYILIGIKQRCENKNDNTYKYYGGRGIKCLITSKELKKLWFRDKANLMKKPSIDRIDNDGHYTYDNCRFIELSENIARMNIETKKKKILQYDLEGNFIREWESIGSASNFYNCHISNISNVLLAKNKTACGFLWRYKYES